MVVNLEKSEVLYLTVSDKILFLLHRYQQPMLARLNEFEKRLSSLVLPEDNG